MKRLLGLVARGAVNVRGRPVPSWFCSTYVFLVFVPGSAIVVTSIAGIVSGGFGYSWVGLSLLTLFCSGFMLNVPGVPAAVTVSDFFVFTIVLCFGPAPAILTVAADGLITSLRSRKRRLRRVLFNVSEPALSLWVAWICFSHLSGPVSPGHSRAPISSLLLPALTMSAVYFLLNSLLTAVAVMAETGAPPYRTWRSHFAWLSVSYFGAASIALFLSSNTQQITLGGLAAAFPLLIVLYIAFKASLERTADANNQLAQLNRLYLATVESFATALDARDHLTHGHVRRVQSYALALARQVGIRDADQLKAIEVAALLHDTGKIAIPDDILNKPGKLTPTEYEQMKRHASIGADILSHVNFPYPVVPIVRHHHENFDGTGYPDRLHGRDIPIGARILSVIDCYDALISDRPYRQALTPEAALEIVRQRRGRMYDPEIVDAFAGLVPELSDVAPESAGEVAISLCGAGTPAAHVVSTASCLVAKERGTPDAPRWKDLVPMARRRRDEEPELNDHLSASPTA